MFYEVGPNPAGWKVSIDELDVGTAVTYMKRADNRPNDPVVGVERARLTMAVFKTSSPMLHMLRSEANTRRHWWASDIPIQYTWDRPSAYRDGSAYSVAVYYASASPVSTVSADPIQSTRIVFDHGEAYDGAHYFNVFDLEDAVAVLTAFRRELVDAGNMLHCHSDEDDGQGLKLTANGGWQVDTTACERTELTDDGIPARDHAVIRAGVVADGYEVISGRGWTTPTLPEHTTGDGAWQITLHASSTYQSVALRYGRSDFQAYAGGQLVVDMKVEGGDVDTIGVAYLSEHHEDCQAPLTLPDGTPTCFVGSDLPRDYWQGDQWKTVRIPVDDRLEYIPAPLYIDGVDVGDGEVTLNVRDARWIRGGNNVRLPPQYLRTRPSTRR